MDNIIKAFLADPGSFATKRETFEVDLCPEAAAALLKDHNNFNRTVTATNVVKLSKAMTGGDFVPGVADLVICTDGHLGNGQHTCLAVVKSGITVQARLTFGLHPDARTVFDTGQSRTGNHAVEMAGISLKNSKAVKAFQGPWLRWERGGCDLIQSGGTGNKINNPDYVRWVQHNKAFAEDCATEGLRLASAYSNVTPTMGALLWAILGKKSARGEFFRLLREGVRTGKGDPLIALDRALEELSTKTAAFFWVRMAVMIHAYNLWLRGTSSTGIKLAYYEIGRTMPKPIRLSNGRALSSVA